MSGLSADLHVEELVLLSVGNLLCGLDINDVQEINGRLEITRVHHAPDYVRGVINLRGQLVTVIDLRRKLGLPMAELDEAMRIVIVRGAEGIVGLLVDRVDDVIDVDPETLEPPPGHIDDVPGLFFSAICKMEDQLAAVLDLERILEK